MPKYIGLPSARKPPTSAYSSMPTPPDTPAPPPALPIEIERKWLLTALPPRASREVPAVLRQGYLPGETLIERIRATTRDGATSWVRTVKLGRGIARIEVEEPASPELGEALFALTGGRRVSKRRYTVSEGPWHWEIDEFADRPLVLAELELPDAETIVTLPDWLAPYVVREVTDESGFTNWQLAR
jgi:CYTH domain-containing protein